MGILADLLSGLFCLCRLVFGGLLSAIENQFNIVLVLAKIAMKLYIEKWRFTFFYGRL